MFITLLAPALLIGLLAAVGLAAIEAAKVALIMYAFKDQDRKDLLLALFSRSRKW